MGNFDIKFILNQNETTDEINLEFYPIQFAFLNKKIKEDKFSELIIENNSNYS